LPTDGIADDEGDFQSEKDCLHLSITLPTDLVNKSQPSSDKKLPVVLFQHGGAFFMGSGDRSYYSPHTFLTQALHQTPSQPLVYVACNFRLGGLGFYHSSQAGNGTSLPPNNGLHDQLHVYAWLKRFIAGFGGDPDNITLIGQSAGSESAHLHSLLAKHAEKGEEGWPFRRTVLLSGSPLCMPAKTPEEHETNFRQQAEKLGIPVKDRTSDDILQDLERIDVDAIRQAGWVGIPCSQSEMMPYKTPSMALLRGEKDENIINDGVRGWVPEQLVSACGFDGGISYNMMIDDDSRKGHAKAFVGIVHDVLRDKFSNHTAAQALLDLYGITEQTDDPTALLNICQFESDVGFFAPALAECLGAASSSTRSYLQLFELGNPFDGPLEKEKYATHTWDIVALLGAFEDKLSPAYQRIVTTWRKKVIAFIVGGGDAAGLQEWRASQDGNRNGEKALVVASEEDGGVHYVDGEAYLGEETRRGRLLCIAREIHPVDGADVLWNDVCRRFLMKGE
jgi:carboxylesterase type B